MQEIYDDLYSVGEMVKQTVRFGSAPKLKLKLKEKILTTFAIYEDCR